MMSLIGGEKTQNDLFSLLETTLVSMHC